MNALNTLASQWEFYTRLFTVQSGIDESNGKGEGQIDDFSTSKKYFNSDDNSNNVLDLSFNFLCIGQQAATFSWHDKRTLSQIEQMTGYIIKPRGVVSQFKHGGYVVYEKDGHGLVAAIIDLGNKPLNLYDADAACNKLELNGYNDWRLPTKVELNELYINLHKFGVGGFTSENYWSSTKFKYNEDDWDFKGWYQAFDSFYKDGSQNPAETTYTYSVRAVRSF